MFHHRCNDNEDGLNEIIAQKSYFASSSNSTPLPDSSVVQINEISNLINTINCLNFCHSTITVFYTSIYKCYRV